jgi:hypothetical protein
MNAVDFDEPIPSKLSHAKALADQDHKIAEKAALIAKALSKVIGAATMAAVSNSISAWPDLKSKDYQHQNVGIAPDCEAYAHEHLLRTAASPLPPDAPAPNRLSGNLDPLDQQLHPEVSQPFLCRTTEDHGEARWTRCPRKRTRRGVRAGDFLTTGVWALSTVRACRHRKPGGRSRPVYLRRSYCYRMTPASDRTPWRTGCTRDSTRFTSPRLSLPRRRRI